MHCDLVWKERRLLCHQRPSLSVPAVKDTPPSPTIPRTRAAATPANPTAAEILTTVLSMDPLTTTWERALTSTRSRLRSPSSVRCRLKCMARSSTSTDKLNMVVNGIKAFFPYYWPSKTDRQLSVELRGRLAVVTNVDGVQLTFGNEYINLKVPQLDEFLGRDGLCGFSGNLNNNCTDDLIGSDGIGLIQLNCAFPRDRVGNARVAKVLDTWQTSDFYGWDPVGTDCVSGEIIAPQLPDCDTRVSARECLPIQQAGAGQGPFAACKDLGPEKIKNMYESCTFDGCYIPGSKCLSFTNFFIECQAALGNVNLPNWRAQTGCPMNCPLITPFSVYDSCVSGCQPTCANPAVVQECNHGCHEGCKCNDGYILDTASDPPKCVKEDDCPCTDNSGQSRPQNFSWLWDN
ncbi:hypothetical protein L596_000134 [Steinernema carpocapsae]|uniref:TIL domain-containing protein n=1 Tax=Steinernema carpocapsae TaxID=34508 RepID=A0A4U8ULF1_STECR|nr:hypothetical protein L596_000134 [Steinernema carpocapsae]